MARRLPRAAGALGNRAVDVALWTAALRGGARRSTSLASALISARIRSSSSLRKEKRSEHERKMHGDWLGSPRIHWDVEGLATGAIVAAALLPVIATLCAAVRALETENLTFGGSNSLASGSASVDMVFSNAAQKFDGTLHSGSNRLLDGCIMESQDNGEKDSRCR